MKKLLSAVVFAAVTAAFAHGAGVPAQNMTPYSISIEYDGLLAGHPGLFALDSSSVAAHVARLSYSPIKYLRLSADLGGGRPFADPRLKGARSGLAAGGGAALFLPKPLPFLSVTAGYDGRYVKYSEADTIYGLKRPAPGSDGDTVSYILLSKSGKTSAALHTPYIGVILHAGRFVDFEIGGLYHSFDVDKTLTVNGFEWDDAAGVAVSTGTTARPAVEIVNEARVYASATLHEGKFGSYLSAGVNAAPAVNEKSWLSSSSVWVSVGVVLTDRARAGKRKGAFSESYVELKELEKEIADELASEYKADKKGKKACEKEER